MLNNSNEKKMENLVVMLKEHTKDLKIKYVEKSDEWAKKEFSFLATTTEQEIIDGYGYYTEKGYRHTKVSFARWGRISNIKYNGLEAYLEKTHKEAKAHYEESILKLAHRVLQKGIEVATIQIKTESQMEKGNISTVLTDASGKKVNAYTVLAWGEINKPHYRYLVK